MLYLLQWCKRLPPTPQSYKTNKQTLPLGHHCTQLCHANLVWVEIWVQARTVGGDLWVTLGNLTAGPVQGHLVHSALWTTLCTVHCPVAPSIVSLCECWLVVTWTFSPNLTHKPTNPYILSLYTHQSSRQCSQIITVGILSYYYTHRPPWGGGQLKYGAYIIPWTNKYCICARFNLGSLYSDVKAVVYMSKYFFSFENIFI